MVPKSTRGILNIRRKCRKKIHERITVLSGRHFFFVCVFMYYLVCFYSFFILGSISDMGKIICFPLVLIGRGI